jgi:hypothetical protein
MSLLAEKFNGLSKGQKLVIESNGSIKVMNSKGIVLSKSNLYYEPDLLNEANKFYNEPPVLRSSSNLDDNFTNLTMTETYLPEEYYWICLVSESDCGICTFNGITYYKYVNPDDMNKVSERAYFSYPKFELQFIQNCNGGVIYKVKRDNRKVMQ